MSRSFRILPVLALLCFNTLAALAQAQDYARDPHQAIDESYTAAIRKYTTEPEFNSPLTDYLPASKNVPTPAKVLGDVIKLARRFTAVNGRGQEHLPNATTLTKSRNFARKFEIIYLFYF